jgi:hypothetical protein
MSSYRITESPMRVSAPADMATHVSGGYTWDGRECFANCTGESKVTVRSKIKTTLYLSNDKQLRCITRGWRSVERRAILRPHIWLWNHVGLPTKQNCLDFLGFIRPNRGFSKGYEQKIKKNRLASQVVCKTSQAHVSFTLSPSLFLPLGRRTSVCFGQCEEYSMDAVFS